MRRFAIVLVTTIFIFVALFNGNASAKPSTNFYHYEQGVRMVKARNWNQAEREFNYYLHQDKIHPDMAGVAHFGLGQMYEAQNRWERAIYEYNLAINNDMHEWFKVTEKSYIKIGSIYMVSGKYQEGLDEFLQLLQKNENNGFAHYFVGRFYVKLKQYDKALLHADRAKELGVRSTRIYDELKDLKQ